MTRIRPIAALALVLALSACASQIPAAAFAMTARSQAAVAEPVAATAQEPAEVLASQFRLAIATHDRQLIFDLVKWEGVREEHRAIFRNFAAHLVEAQIESVTIEELGGGHGPFEHQGETFAKNGAALGQVTISLVVAPPTVSEYIHLPYGIEDDRAVILLDAPVAADVEE